MMDYLLLGWGAAIEGTTGDELGAALLGEVDLTGDGALDVVVGAPGVSATYTYAGSASGLALSASGTGTSGDRYGAALAAGDFDGDGVSSLAVGAPGGDGAVHVDEVTLAGGEAASFGSALASGDLDGDGYVDLVVGAPGGAGAAYLFLGSGSGLDSSVASGVSGSAEGDALGTALAVADLDADGLADVLAGAPGASGGLGAAYLFPGSGAGLASATWSYTVTNGSGLGASLASGDFDGDGYIDAVLSGGMGLEDLALFAGSAAGLGSTPDVATESPATASLVLALDDLDGDGASELLLAHDLDPDLFGELGCDCPWPASQVLVTGDPWSGGWASASTASFSAATRAGDLDGDGVMELVATSASGVGLHAVAVDNDRDGLAVSGDADLVDCDDTDADVHPLALETDADGIDGDCDGADSRDTTSTAVFTCPSFATPAEAFVLAADPDAALGSPRVELLALVDALAAAGCSPNQTAATYQSCDGIAAEAVSACEDVALGLVGTVSALSAVADWAYDDAGDCQSSSTTTTSLLASMQLATPSPSGVASADVWLREVGDSEVADPEMARIAARVAWSDGTESWLDVGTVGRTSWDIDDAWTDEASFDGEHANCALAVEYTDYVGAEQWTVTDDARRLTVVPLDDLWFTGCNTAPADDTVGLADLDGATSVVNLDDWSPAEGTDNDGDGWPVEYGDCDDNEPMAHPCADELFTDAIDNDCDGKVETDSDGDGATDDRDCDPFDPACAAGCVEGYFLDGDGDGVGLDAAPPACTPDPAWSEEGEDCDDSDADVYPGAPEACNGASDDCDSAIDEDPVNAPGWYPDADGDGHGDAFAPATLLCEAPWGMLGSANDCDDADAFVYPLAPEVPGDGIDQDCDGRDAEPEGDKPVEEPATGCAGGLLPLVILLTPPRRPPRPPRRPAPAARSGGTP